MVLSVLCFVDLQGKLREASWFGHQNGRQNVHDQNVLSAHYCKTGLIDLGHPVVGPVSQADHLPAGHTEGPNVSLVAELVVFCKKRSDGRHLIKKYLMFLTPLLLLGNHPHKTYLISLYYRVRGVLAPDF